MSVGLKRSNGVLNTCQEGKWLQKNPATVGGHREREREKQIQKQSSSSQERGEGCEMFGKYQESDTSKTRVEECDLSVIAFFLFLCALAIVNPHPHRRIGGGRFAISWGNAFPWATFQPIKPKKSIYLTYSRLGCVVAIHGEE